MIAHALPPHMAQVAGHFGELIQGRMGAQGPVALISLPCPPFTLTAMARPAAGLSLHSPLGAPSVTPARARRFLGTLGLQLRAKVVLHAAMPVGAGAGASTAALVALAQLAGWRGDALALARACVASEGASDPLMLPKPAQTLWASREGRILSPLPPLPRFDILGGFWGPIQRTNAADYHFPDISALVCAWHSAAATQDLDALARLATASAKMTLALRGPANDPTEALAQRLGAKGFIIAHTGAARGLIFAPGAVPAQGLSSLRAAGLLQPMMFRYQGI